MAPASTGKESTKRNTVTKTVHTKRFSSPVLVLIFIFSTVLIKLIPPKIEEAPAKCKE